MRVLPWLLCATLAAQQPAPAVETDRSVWSAEEGNVLFRLRASLWRIRGQAADPLHSGNRSPEPDGYTVGLFVRSERGDVESLLSPEHTAGNAQVFAVAWPCCVRPKTRHALLVHADGTRTDKLS